MFQSRSDCDETIPPSYLALRFIFELVEVFNQLVSLLLENIWPYPQIIRLFSMAKLGKNCGRNCWINDDMKSSILMHFAG